MKKKDVAFIQKPALPGKEIDGPDEAPKTELF